jgi:hypothetical protein
MNPDHLSRSLDCRLINVRSWHFPDVAGLTDDVGSWGQSGLSADIAKTTRRTHLGHGLSQSIDNFIGKAE